MQLTETYLFAFVAILPTVIYFRTSTFQKPESGIYRIKPALQKS